MANPAIAQRIRQLRRERGIRQSDLADLLHIHPTNYAKIERAERKVSIDEGVILAAVCRDPPRRALPCDGDCIRR